MTTQELVMVIYAGYLGFLQNVKGLSRDRVNAAESIFQNEELVQEYLNWLDVSCVRRCENASIVFCLFLAPKARLDSVFVKRLFRNAY